MPNALSDATLGSLTLLQVTGADFSANGDPIPGVTTSGIDVAEYFGGPVDLRASFTTEDIASVCAVSNIATAGLTVSAGTIAIPYRLRANLSTFAAGSSHYILSGTHGMIYPTSFNIPSGGSATASLECIFVSSDGATVPVAVNVSQALGSEAFNAIHTLGPVSINGTTIDKVTNVTVTPGLGLLVEFYRHNFLVDCFIVSRRPMIEVTTYDLAALSALGSAWGIGTAVVAYARKRDGTSFVADATAEHCSFTFADGIVKPVMISGGAASTHASRTLRFFGEALVVSGATAIT